MADITKRLLSLSNETGYHILQRNGQRRYGPPPNWKGPAPKGTEIFVGKIPRDCYEDELVPVFSCVGQIYEMRLMMDFSGSNRGYCFVSYSTPSESYKAVRELNGYQIRPKKYLGVVKSVDNCRLFVGGVPKTKTRENIYEELSKYVDGIVDVILYNSSSDKSLNRGFAFIEFENHRAAAMARRVLIPGRIQVWENDLMVDWAEPEPDVDEDVMKEVKILYVRNLNADTNLATLQTIFENAINYRVERVKKIKDFAFVHFFRRDQAQMALDTLNNTMVDGCLIEVKWAKPVSNEFRLNKMRFSKYGCHGEVRALDLEDKFAQWNIGTSDTDLSLGLIEDGSRSSALTALCLPKSYAPRVCVPEAQDLPTPTFMSQTRVPAGVSQLAVAQPCAIQRLDAICKKYNWSKPEYFYWKLADCSSWLASVVLPAVGAPLFKVDRVLGPSHSHALGSPTSYLACVGAAQQLLLTMKKICDQENRIQQVPVAYDSTAQFSSALPFQQTMQTTLPYSLPVSANPGPFSLHTWPPQCN